MHLPKSTLSIYKKVLRKIVNLYAYIFVNNNEK